MPSPAQNLWLALEAVGRKSSGINQVNAVLLYADKSIGVEIVFANSSRICCNLLQSAANSHNLSS